MKNIFIMLSVIFVVTGCAAMADVFSDTLVVTTMDNVRPGASITVIPEEEIPVSVSDQAPFGSTIVTADESDVIDPTHILGRGSKTGKIESFASTVFDIGTMFFPWLAAWEGALTVFFPRKRKHYATALTRLIPGNKFSVGGSLNSFVAGMGMKHTADVQPPTNSEVKAVA